MFQGLQKPFDYRYEGYQKPGRGTKNREENPREQAEKKAIFEILDYSEPFHFLIKRLKEPDKQSTSAKHDVEGVGGGQMKKIEKLFLCLGKCRPLIGSFNANESSLTALP